MQDKPEETGTPDPSPEAVEETGTPEQVEDGGEGKPIPAELARTWEKNLVKERARNKELAEEVERLRAGTGSGQPSPAATGPDADEEEQVRAAWMQLEAAAKQGDPYAIVQLATAKEAFRRQRRLESEIERERIPEPEREGTEKFFATGDYRTREAARKAWLGSMSDEEREKLRPRPKREAAPREREEVVETVTRPVNGAGVSARGNLKMGEWHREWDSASAKGDTKRMDELRQSYPR